VVGMGMCGARELNYVSDVDVVFVAAPGRLPNGAEADEYEALRTATLNPARFLNATDRFGSVERGKIADLVLLDANPLQDITATQRIHAVISNGRHLPRATLDVMLADVERIVSRPPRP